MIQSVGRGGKWWHQRLLLYNYFGGRLRCSTSSFLVRLELEVCQKDQQLFPVDLPQATFILPYDLPQAKATFDLYLELLLLLTILQFYYNGQ